MKQVIEDEIRQYVKDLKSMNLEIISLCNMSREHCTECPNAWRSQNLGRSKIDLEVIKNLLKELNQLGYTGKTGLHSYNEPLMDKRIYEIIKLHKELCPAAKVLILSNGRLLTVPIAIKLLKLGIDELAISAYDKPTFDRLSYAFEKLKPKFPNCNFVINPQKLDDRMQYYNFKTRAEQGLREIDPCLRVKEQLVITSTGNVQLCCYEWKNEMKFGNINQSTLTEVLKNSDFLSVRKNLIDGYRNKYFPCDRCVYG